MLPCQRPRQNTLPPVLVVHKYFICRLFRYGLCRIEVVLDNVPLLCDNESAIKLANNPVQRTRTKRIDIRHHFLRDHVAIGDISLENVGIENQLVDIFTKPIDEVRFCMLRNELNVLDLSNFTNK